VIIDYDARLVETYRYQMVLKERYQEELIQDQFQWQRNISEVEKKKGLRWMQDRNGNTVNVSAAGVVHSSGKGITFTRDGAGRITKMTDPMGAALTYEYDVDGNLTAVVDREGKRTTYAYNDQHGLRDIFDPRQYR
jgi:YD repeat-containing protein